MTNDTDIMNGDMPASTAAQSAWVVFSGQADVPWLNILRPGFRHCFVIINDGRGWLSVDPMLNHMDVQAHHHVPASFDLPGWLLARGLCVMAAPVSRARRSPAPWRPFTCVEAVKRVLGLHARLIFTPWQLYRHLQKLSRQISNINEKEFFHGKPELAA